MLWAITMLLLYQLAGEAVVTLLGLPIPGPVAGMVFLFITLRIWWTPTPVFEETTHGLLHHLSLLFIPAGVGIMEHETLLRNEWLAISATIVVGTLITMIVTGYTMSWLLRSFGHTAAPTEEPHS